MKISLSDKFTYRRLLTFVLPSILMMICTSIYTMVDGFFVSNFAGQDSFSALNLIFPFVQILQCIGFILTSGSVALVSKSLGEKNNKRANEIFSMTVFSVIILGIIFSVLGFFLMRPVAIKFGAEGNILTDCITYGKTLMVFNIFFMLQNLFQSFFICAEKPKLGFAVTLGAGLTNMLLDYVFVSVLKKGIFGAAIATGLSQFIGGIVPLVYFLCKNSSLLRICRAKIELRVMAKSCTNGASEFMTNVSLSVVGMLYNYKLMQTVGPTGVAAYGVLIYIQFLFIAIFIGFSMGTAPIVGYNFGAANHEEMQNIFKKCMVFNLVTGLLMTIISFTCAPIFAKIFVGYNDELLEMTIHAFKFYSAQFLFIGVNIFSSSFFTSLSDGLVSAILSFTRLFVYQVICVLVLPTIFGIDGIWSATSVAELFGIITSSSFLFAFRKKYHYIKEKNHE